MIFAVMSAAAGYAALYDEHLSDTQVHIATAALKHHDPSLLAHDAVFGARHWWRIDPPAFQTLMDMVLAPTEYRDPLLPFRAMTGAVVMVYLCGMYALLYRQCRSWSIAAFTSVLSLAVIETTRGSSWGAGSLASITPPTLCVSVLPLIMLAYLRYRRQWQVMLVFGALGVLANFDLAASMNMTCVLVTVHLFVGRFSPRVCVDAAGGALLALLGALPHLWYYYGLRLATGAESATAPAVLQVLHEANVLYPGLFKPLLEAETLVRMGVLLIAAVVVLARVDRYRVRQPAVWVYFMAAVTGVTFAGQGASQLVGKLGGGPPPLIGFVEAFGLILLPLYVLLAQALTNAFRLVTRQKGILRAVCLAFLAAWVIPSDNLSVARHGVKDLYVRAAGAVSGQTDLPTDSNSLRRHRRRELEAIAEKARRLDRQALFIVDSNLFRMLSRRAIVACQEDRRYVYALSPSRLDEWTRRFDDQDELLDPPGHTNPQAVVRFAEDLSVKGEFVGVSEWYVILQAPKAPPSGNGLEEIHPGSWGRHYRLYRVMLPPKPSDQGAATRGGVSSGVKTAG